ncbi:iron ABC transporter permease [Rhodoferax aquaticus]|uniref:Iron ABC transporter permease n=1 Tax=Rhodoferax aquaticus TaxID=2527691 RepID=A0A515EVL6_9BURK|nr:iron ABC transporter permease [Rhodoferax aquaticus]
MVLVWTLAGVLAALVLLAVGVCVGSTGFENLLGPLLHPAQDPVQTAMAQQIVWQIRLPRTAGAWAAGALLGLAGAVAQGLFRNPLADPYLLGSASGASLGVALALAALGGGAGMLSGSSAGSMMNGGMALSVFSSSVWVRIGLTGAAFLGAVVAVLLTLLLSKGVGHTLRLLLAGVVVGVVLGAMTHLVLLFTPDSLQAMQAFMLGSTAFVGWTSCWLMAGVWAVCVLAAWLLARVLDGLSLGDATAVSLGLPVAPMRAALVAVLALATGTAVAQTGLIAFVGLAAPHLVRSVIKTTHAHLMLLSSLVGGVLLMAADTLARGLLAPQELPVGVLTAVLGGGYLLWLMHRGTRSGGGAL